jgi:hypothetical protein
MSGWRYSSNPRNAEDFEFLHEISAANGGDFA